MGFNPHRKYRATTGDYAMVAVAILCAVGLLAWAFLG